MPQLISHRDGFGWQTPNVADVLDPARKVADQTADLRSTATVIVRKLAELGAPVRLKSMDIYVSHTRFHFTPDKVGGKGQERAVTLGDLEAALPGVLAEVGGQAAQLVQLAPPEPTITLFLRTAKNTPLGLRTLLEQNTFIESPGYTNMTLGVNLMQQAQVFDMQAVKHLLIVGSSAARLHLQLGIAATMMIFNSPSYVRLGLIGGDTTPFRLLAKSPHILGNVVSSVSGLQRLLEGLTKHITQRRSMFEKQKVDTLDAFNRQALSNRDLSPLPRIVLLLDSVALPNWRSTQSSWLVPLSVILNRGHEVGIHVLLAATGVDAVPERLVRTFNYRFIMRSVLGSQAKLPPQTPLEFIDGVLQKDGELIPLELAAVQDTEITRLVTYWLNMRTRRNAELEHKGQPATTGNTGLLTLRDDMLPPPPITRETPIVTAKATTNGADEMPYIPDQIVLNARALAAYLGWLSTGPLVDVLNLSLAEADETLRILRAIEVLEPGEGPVWRFARLADLPQDREK
jgi:hypothetical protein